MKKLAMVLLACFLVLRAQSKVHDGHVLRVEVRDGETKRPLRGASVRCGKNGSITDRNGTSILTELSDSSIIITRMAGYVEQRDTIWALSTQQSLLVELSLNVITTPDVTVTASRYEQSRQDAPVIVTVSDQQVFHAAQAVSLSEGLSYQPGLRIENNCQNCGFTQVRLNGLQGPYTQILIDSRPVFSALNGVYGLEQIPAAMVDRIEVVRGGGSVLYGAGAIAGTINVITRDPLTTSVAVSSTASWLNGLTRDATITARGTWVSNDLLTGVTFFGVGRDRQPLDMNGDGFSEVPLLRNTSVGARGVHQVTANDRLTLEGHWIREFRRGGNDFTRAPHEADIAEQLDHSIGGGAATYEHAFLGDRSRISAYGSMQTTQRYSYYGGTGGDSTQLAAAKKYYGSTNNIIAVGGMQFTSQEWRPLDVTSVVIAGVEIAADHVVDEMPGYGRSIDQATTSTGLYAQVQIAPSYPLSVALGIRYNILHVNGTYQFDAETQQHQDRTFHVVNPRISIIGRLSDEIQLRGTYAGGFRGPQAFDEDLHLSTLQGFARLIRIDPQLRPERSHSVTLSFDANTSSPTSAFGITIDGFATLLQAPFVTSLTSETVAGSTASIALKTNGDAAWVAGINTELRHALSRRIETTIAFTVQDARYETAQVLAQGPDGRVVSSTYITRTPNVYGSFTSSFLLGDDWSADIATIVTGPMNVVNERTITMHRTPWFCDLALRCAYDIHIADVWEMTIGAGIVNIFGAYQQDLERGAMRDAAYVYGPLRPRTFTLSLGVAWQ